MGNFWQDVRYGARMLWRSPGFTVVAVLALALGVGATTAIFSVMNAVLWRPLPFREPDRLVMIWMDNRRFGMHEDIHSYPNYEDYRNQNTTFAQLAAYTTQGFNLTGVGEPERVIGAATTATFFEVMGTPPALGNPFTQEAEQPGRDTVVLISHGLWQRRFGGDPQVIGQNISLNGATRTVVGVMPPDFAFPGKEIDLWVPLAAPPDAKQARSAFWLSIIGRLKPGVTFEQARTELGGIWARLEQQYPDLGGYGVNPVPLHTQIVGNVRPALFVLLGAVGFVLLIACANVANLLLARATARGREIAIRAALGAGRGRIVRQLLTESVLLALAGGVAGALLAMWGLGALKALAPADTPRLEQIGVDARVFAFALGLSCVTALVFGLAPALQASKPDLNETLKEGGRSDTTGGRGRRLRDLLVVSEIALTLVLLVGAGLLLKSFVRLQEFKLGYRPEGLLTASVSLPRAKYSERAKRVAFYEQLMERLRNSPGVEGVAAVGTILLSNTPNSTIITIEGRPNPRAAERTEVPFDATTPDFFKVMGTPLLRGRFFDARDRDGATPVAIVNETFARKFFPNEDPLGHRYLYGDPGGEDSQWLTIVGVVADMKRTDFNAEVRPETFFPHAQGGAGSMMLVVRTAGDPAALANLVRTQVRALDPDQPVYAVRTMDEQLSERRAQRRFNMLLLGLFAGLALALAAVGLYGVMAYTVTQRTHELAVRMALGARAADVFRLVVGRGMLLAAVGIAVGFAASLALTRLMTGLLFSVSATDPATYAAVSFLLASVALAGCLVPARRATKVDPMVALRYE
ncbi:MAG TPA: ABC transporter permease [Pyrinomonadaceae bacterium]|jgi:putative ABC transport system permease protein